MSSIRTASGSGSPPTRTRTDDAAAGVLLAEPIDPLLSVQVRHLGGALAEDLAEPFLLYLFGIPFSTAVTAAIRRRQADLIGALGKRVTGRKPYTFLAPGEKASAAFEPATIARLRTVKRARDPHNVIRANFPVLR